MRALESRTSAWLLYITKNLALTQGRSCIRTGATVGGDDAEVAATHSRGNRDGLDLGSSMVRCGLSAALVVWPQSRCPVPSRLRCTRLHCGGHVPPPPGAGRGWP